jgi:hypothetical protein
MADERSLAEDIDAFVEEAIRNDDGVPDLWDENDTTDRLARFLIERGWRRPTSGDDRPPADAG